MKKVWLPVFATLILTACMTESAMFSTKPLYSVISEPVTSISGDYINKELVLYKKTRLTGTESITLSKREENEESSNIEFILRINQMDWVFPESLLMSTNGEIFNLKPGYSDRNVISGNNVEEKYYFLLEESEIISLKNVETLKFQLYKNEVIEVDPEGIVEIHNFLSN